MARKEEWDANAKVLTLGEDHDWRVKDDLGIELHRLYLALDYDREAHLACHQLLLEFKKLLVNGNVSQAKAVLGALSVKGTGIFSRSEAVRAGIQAAARAVESALDTIAANVRTHRSSINSKREADFYWFVHYAGKGIPYPEDSSDEAILQKGPLESLIDVVNSPWWVHEDGNIRDKCRELRNILETTVELRHALENNNTFDMNRFAASAKAYIDTPWMHGFWFTRRLVMDCIRLVFFIWHRNLRPQSLGIFHFMPDPYALWAKAIMHLLLVPVILAVITAAYLLSDWKVAFLVALITGWLVNRSDRQTSSTSRELQIQLEYISLLSSVHDEVDNNIFDVEVLLKRLRLYDSNKSFPLPSILYPLVSLLRKSDGVAPSELMAFQRATEQLASKTEVNVRYAAVEVLRAIARRSPELRSIIYRVLLGHVTVNCPLGDNPSPAEDSGHNDARPTMDIQAALEIICNSSGANAVETRSFILDLSRTDLRGADFSGQQLRQARFFNANLMNADFSFAQLQDAWLPGANLESADFSHADLSRANLEGANLVGANLEAANLDGTFLAGVDLSRCVGLTQQQVASAIVDRLWFEIE